jgi:hypothetical protein
VGQFHVLDTTADPLTNCADAFERPFAPVEMRPPANGVILEHNLGLQEFDLANITKLFKVADLNQLSSPPMFSRRTCRNVPAVWLRRKRPTALRIAGTNHAAPASDR